MAATTTPRLREKYEGEISKELLEKFGYSSSMQIPKPVKVVINMGLGHAPTNPKTLENALVELGSITGQKAVPTKARKSISNFKLREGVPVGASVTLRGDRMWEFLDRLIATAIPRIRDFRGMNPNGFDGRGNYTFGVTEQLIFPEIDYDKVAKVRGMDITFVTTAATDEQGRALLDAFGFPFRRQQAGV